MAEFNFKVSPKIITGRYSLGRIGSELDSYGKRALLITEKSLRGRALQLQKTLESDDIETIIYQDTDRGAATIHIEDAVSVARKGHASFIIGMGGVNALVFAKSVAVLAASMNSVDDFYSGDMVLKSALPYIEIPTAGRNPFMLLNYTTITDFQTRKMRFCPVPNDITKLVVSDTDLFSTISSGYLHLIFTELLFQAAECYLSGHSSFFSDLQIVPIIERCQKAFDLMVANKEDARAPEILAETGILTAFAQSLTGITPGLVLSYTAAAYLNLPRASISTIIAPYFLESGIYASSEKAISLAKVLDTNDVGATLSESIRNYCGLFDAPSRLRDLGVRNEQISPASEIAGDLAAELFPGTNRDEFFRILESAY